MHLGIYRHYKGAFYEVLGIAKHSETLEELVVYSSLKTNELWVRPKKMFLVKVSINGEEIPRFLYISAKETFK